MEEEIDIDTLPSAPIEAPLKKEEGLLSLLHQILKDTWLDIKLDKKELIIDRAEKILIAKEDKDFYYVNRVAYTRATDTYESYSNPTSLVIDKSIDIEDLLRIVVLSPGRYWLAYMSHIKKILSVSFEIGAIHVGKFNKISIAPVKKSIKVPLSLYLEMIEHVYEVQKKSGAYKNSIERYLINKLIKKYRNIEIKNVTNTEKGEFNFLVNRFNLPIKSKQQEFKKYLDSNDINAIQELTKSLIVHKIFREDFLRGLDDYFIKDKLKDVVKLGRKILSFKGKKLDTKLGRELIAEISPDVPVKQLETLWQRYFEKNLLYLIFSYKKIFSKFGLQIEGTTKFPDFVGVNHYNGVDIIEIKTHLTPVLTFDSSHKNFSFSPDLSKAIIQTTNYMDAIRQDHFNDDDDREKIVKYTSETNLYRPRGIIVISSWDKIVKNSKVIKKHEKLLRRDFTKLRNSLDNIEILTFDEIIDIADNYSSNIITDK